jgi:hypothetical protein
MPRHRHPASKLAGKTFGALTVIRRVPNDDKYRWECVCTCGETVLCSTQSLTQSTVKVCWCSRRKRPNQITVTHRNRV